MAVVEAGMDQRDPGAQPLPGTDESSARAFCEEVNPPKALPVLSEAPSPKCPSIHPCKCTSIHPLIHLLLLCLSCAHLVATGMNKATTPPSSLPSHRMSKCLMQCLTCSSML
jgi:hypothetical protein